MPKRSSKKKQTKGPKLSPEEQLELLQQEADARWKSDQEAQLERDNADVKQYNQRRVVLIETAKFFRKLEKTATELHRKEQKEADWQHYLSCEKLPNPARAAELREFLFRWSYELAENRRRWTSWTLDTDERSPLTQDETVPVETRGVLRRKNADIGALYLPGIRAALRILALIEDSTQKDLPQHEVVLVRDEIRKTVAAVLDEITMRVGGNIWRDMIPLDPISAEFAFTSDILNCYLWSFRDVPLPPEYNYLVKSLHLSSLQATLLKPLSFDLKDALMRGLWSLYDHFSDLDPTFRCGFVEPVPDLMASQEIEWSDRNNLKMKRLQEMKAARAKFEADQRQKELDELEAAKNAGGAQKGSAKGGEKKKKKAPKKKKKKGNEKPPLELPPPVVTEGTTVDIDDDYVQQELQLYQQKIEQIGPNSLSLPEGYVNLREYRIAGGVYSVGRFEKLPQPTELRCDFIYTHLPLDLKLAEKKFKAETNEDLIKIELKLPDYCFWWHDPVVCSWEIWEESPEFSSLHQELQDFHLNFEQVQAEKSKLLFAAPKPPKRHNRPTIIPDFNMNDIPPEIKLYFLIEDHILPRLPQSYKFYAEMHDLFQTMQCLFLQEQRLVIEEALNELLYPKFLALRSVPPPVAPSTEEENDDEVFRVPSSTDIPEEEESYTSLQEDPSSPTITTPVQSMLQEMALTQQVPAYLFPPERHIPLLVLTEEKELAPGDLEFDEMLLELQVTAACDNEFSSEAVTKMFSTFLKLLDYLRNREQPEFPEPPEEPEPEDGEEVEAVQRPRPSRVRSHLHPKDDEMIRRLSYRRQSSFLIATKQRQQLAGTVKKARRKRQKSATLTTSDVSTDEESESKVAQEEPAELQLLPHPAGRWTTRLVHHQEFNSAEKIVTISVSQLGTFGFAMEKYFNLPFRGWEMRRTGKITDLTTSVTLICTGITVIIDVTKVGYRLHFHDAPQNITPPTEILSLDQLEKYLIKTNVVVFPEPDAPFYVHGMTTPKHESMEAHTLKCMAAFCLTHNFTNCFWNRFAAHRDALLQARQLIEGRKEPPFVTVLANPLKAATVTVEECCSPLDQVLLEFHPEPEGQAYNPDVYNLLKDTLEEPSRKLLLKTPPILQWNVAQLLQKLRLLSYS